MRIHATPYTIVGVMPQRFTLGGNPDMYMPFSQLAPPLMKQLETEPHLIAFAKLRPGVTPQQADAAVDPMIHAFAKENPTMYPWRFQTRLQLLIDGFTSRSSFVKSLPMLFLAVTMLLLIGCANCSILLLARATVRQHEMAVRAAVGATRLRIVRQLLIESLTLSLLGSALGVVFCYYLARLPLRIAADLFPSESVIRVNATVPGFCVGTALLTGVLFGLLPAVRASQPLISKVLQSSGRRSTSGAGQKTLRLMIGAQIALTLALLTVAGGAGMGFLNIVRLRLGFDPHNVAVINIAFHSPKTDTWAARVAEISAIHRAIQATPGVLSVASSDDIPPSGGGTEPIDLVGRSTGRGADARGTDVSPNYFSTLRIPLLTGRIWSEQEARLGLPLAVVNQAFARRFFPHQTPIGQLIRFPKINVKQPPAGYVPSPALSVPEVEIIGVVGDAVNDGLNKPVTPDIYMNANMMPTDGVLLMVRTQTDPHRMMAAFRDALGPFRAGNYQFVFPMSLEDMVHGDPYWQQQRLISILFGIYAAMALTLALVGLYSTAQYIALQRRGELGIRLALGATRAHVRWMVLRGNLLVIGYAAVAGLLFSLLARAGTERWMASSSQSPVVLIAAAALLVLVAIAACLVPAERASRLNPNEVLRAE